MKKVSVIVPAYNAEKYLEKCLNSLVNQTLEDIEIIIVNDGSTDNTQKIIEDYYRNYPEKIKFFEKVNGGQSTARNLALENAIGEYIGCVDADDYVDINMFKEMYSKAIANKSDIVACESYKVENNVMTISTFSDYPERNKLFIDAWVSPCTKIIKKSVYEKSGIKFLEGFIYEDTAWFCEIIAYINKINVVHKPLYYRMVNENSTMTAAQGIRTSQIFPVMNHVVDFYKEKGLFEQYKNEVEYFYIRILLLSSLERISRIDDNKLRRQYTEQTLNEILDKFPNFKRNKYLVGLKGKYIKCVNRYIIHLFVLIFRILSKIKNIKRTF